MFTYTLEPFVDSSLADSQVGTTFTLAEDKEFTKVVTSIKKIKPDNIFLFTYSSLLEPDKNYYLKARRHFLDTNLDMDTKTRIVRHDKKRSEGLIYNREDKITKPWIYVNGDDIIDKSKDTFTIKTSAYKSNMSGHESTTYIITDGLDKVIFASIEDKVNKTSIEIKKTLRMVTTTKLNIMVIHRGAVGIESEVSKVTLSLQRFNFEIKSRLDNLQPAKDYKLKLKRINMDAKMNVFKIDVVHPTTKEVIWSTPTTSEGPELEFTLPWSLFKPNTIVRVIIGALDTNKEIGYKIVELYPSTTKIKEIEDFGFTYKNEIESILNPTYSSQCDGVQTMEIPLGYIPMPIRNNKHLYKFIYKDGALVNTNKILKGVELLDNENDDIYIKYTDNGLLIVDTKRYLGAAQKKPVMLVYRHDLHTDTYDLVKMIEHPLKDKYTAATNGALTQFNESEFIYMSPSLDHLYKFDIIAGTCTELAKLPGEKDNKINTKWFMRMAKQRLYVQCTDESITYKYEILKNKFEESINVEPNSFIKAKVCTRMLPNGDNLIFKTQHTRGDKDKSLIRYKYASRHFEEANITFKSGEFPTGSILLLNNSVLLSKVNTDPVSNISTLYMYKFI